MARKEDYRQRYTVERSFAWLGNCRRLLIRWERLLVVYRGFFALALTRVSPAPPGLAGICVTEMTARQRKADRKGSP